MSGLTFLSWVREGLAAAGGKPDPTSGAMPARTTVTLRPKLSGRAPVAVEARLLGPGDVTGLDPAQMLRSFPAPDSDGAEPHLFPAVEFDRPDLPWMFTPAAATAEGRLRPWLVLVVVEAEGAELLPGDGTLPRLRCDRAELPDLAQSWAWAHAQVATGDDTGEAEVDRLLAEEPDRALSRLLCPRRLLPGKGYLAAVVPAFEAGRLAGLGRPVPDGDLVPAWPAPGDRPEVTRWELPVYHHWRFATGLDGDFESLVRALAPHALAGDLGTRPLDVGDAGPGLPALPEGHPGRTTDLEGALRPAGTEPRAWDEDTAAAFRAAYTDVLDAGPSGTVLTPPVYGSAQAGTTGLPAAGDGPAWLRDLNLDPRHRAAAALGAEVVRRHQEDLVAATWDQAAEVGRANEALRQGQLARSAATSLHRRLTGPAPDAAPQARWVGAGMPDRVFVVSADGRLLARVTRNGRSTWVDHGPPPGTTAASSPVALLDRHVFVVGADGTLRELSGGDTWVWKSHGSSGAAPLRGGEGALSAVSGPDGDQPPTVYGTDTAGTLWQLAAGAGPAWTWAAIGPAGRRVTAVRAADPHNLLLLDTDGWMIEYARDGGTWTTRDRRGVQPTSFSPDRGAPDLNALLPYAVTAAGELFQGGEYIHGWVWTRLDAPPIGRIVGRRHDGRVLLATTDARIVTVHGEVAETGGGRAPVGPDQVLSAAVSGTLVYAVGDGRLMVTDPAGDDTWRVLDGPGVDDERDARTLQITSAAQDAIPYGDGTAAREVARNEEAAAAMDPAFRRLLRPGGPLVRRSLPPAGDPAAALAAGLADRTERAVPPLPVPAGLAGVENVSSEETFENLTDSRLSTRWWEKNPTEPRETVPPAVPVIRWVGAAMDNRVFVVTTDGRLMSRVTQAGVPGWVDHGAPPGTTAASAPVAVQDLDVFVVGADGTLRHLSWDGDQWVWRNQGMPDGRKLTAGEAALSAVVRYQPAGDISNTNYLHLAVYCVDTLYGKAWEFSAGANRRWAWEGNLLPSTTAPRGGVRVVGDWILYGLDYRGSLYEFVHDGTRWVAAPDIRGVPRVGFDAARGVPDWCGHHYGAAAGGQLYESRPSGQGITWVPSDAPPIGRIIGRGHDGNLLMSTTDARVITQPGGGAPVGGGRAPVGADQVLSVAVHGRYVYAVGDGQLMVADRMGNNTWQVLGRPEYGGKGDPDAFPPVDIRWRPQPGFLSNLLVGHVSLPGTPQMRLGRDTDFDASVHGGWQLKGAVTGPEKRDLQGFGLATADMDGSGRPDAVVFWIEEYNNQGHKGNFGRYRIARNLDGNADPASWVGPVTMPTPMSTTTTASGGSTAVVTVQTGSCALADLDGDGGHELLVAYVGGVPGNNRLFLRIGWNIDPGTGLARGGWSDSVEIPWPDRPSYTAPTVLALDIAVADLDGDLWPELVVLLVEQTPEGPRARYRVGWNINARGRVKRWGDVVTVPGPFPPGGTAGLVIADFSGSERPDLGLLVLGDSGSATLRVGWEVEKATGVPGTWSAPVQEGGWPGGRRQAVRVALADLPGDLPGDRRKSITNRFRTAAQHHQRALLAAYKLADQASRDEPPQLATGQVASAVRAAADPERAVTDRVVARIDGADLTGPDARKLPDRLGPLLTPPSFTQPMAELLAELGTGHLLPGTENIPPDSVTLLRANAPFVEAFLAGANHELGRELLWREFPTDRSATAFRYFWDARGTVEPGREQPDVPPMREWGRDSGLGENLRRPEGGDDAVVLLVRGEVVRRFPSLGLHARRALPPDTPGGPGRLGERVEPVFSGRIGTDVLFTGFPLTTAQALGEDGTRGWWFVFEQHPSAPAFGLDHPPKAPEYGKTPKTWQDVSWASVADSAEELAALRHAGIRAPFGTDPLPLYPAATEPKVSWGHNAAAMAHITLQRPVRVAHHASALLPVPGPGLRVSHVRTRVPGDGEVFVREVAGRHPDGRWWRMTRAEALDALDGRQRLYMEPAPGERVPVTAVTAGGRRGLRAAGPGTADHLLTLPDIPEDAYAGRPALPSAR